MGSKHSTVDASQSIQAAKKTRRRQLHSVYSPSILTLWIRHHSPLHSHLSLNITREICSYLTANHQKLIVILPKEVRHFDTVSNQWRLLWKLTKGIPVKNWHASTFIAEQEIFLCGSGYYHKRSCTCHIDNCTYILEGDGSVQTLPSMPVPRQEHGIIYRAGVVYVFGGINLSGIALRHCAKFVISSNSWKALPKMHEARWGFNTCWFSSAVYLCGGGRTSVETFNPQSKTFTLLPCLTLPEPEFSTAVVSSEGELVVVSTNYICTLQQRGLVNQKHSLYRPDSNCPPVVRGEFIYSVTLTQTNRARAKGAFLATCNGINLVTGEVRSVILLS